MYLIDETYFEKYEIPNISDPNAKPLEQLIRIVDEKSRLLLLNALPFDQFQDLQSYIDPTTQQLMDTAPPKWDGLVNGVEYDNALGIQNKWNGLKYQFGSVKDGILSQLAYYWFIRANASYQTGVGEVRAAAKNAVNVNVDGSVTGAWNNFIHMYQGNYIPFGCNLSDWSWEYYYTGSDRSVSLLQFLTENPTIYPDLNPKYYEMQNIWGV